MADITRRFLLRHLCGEPTTFVQRPVPERLADVLVPDLIGRFGS
jgi:hypothetical protein